MSKKLVYILSLIIMSNTGCETPSGSAKLIDVQGHRGCRGLMPENSIPAFIRALELGVTTLEMDLVISKDEQVVVSHEPFFSHEISTAPDGSEISEANEMEHNLFELTYSEITQYDVGLKTHSRFPKQEKLSAVKPLFSEVVATMERYAEENNLKKPYYNVEIKRQPKWDSIYHPPGSKFAELVVKAVQDTGIKERIVIQSFDPESLLFVNYLDPDIDKVLLVENIQSAEDYLLTLPFKPQIYSPSYELVDASLIDLCREKDILLIPWTVNEKQDMRSMLELGVDGIITDYPDELITLMKELEFEVK